MASHWAPRITRASRKPPIDSNTNTGSTGEPEVVVPLAMEVVGSPPDPVYAGIDAVEVVAAAEVVVDAGAVVLVGAGAAVVVTAAEVGVVLDEVVVDGSVVVVSNVVALDEVDVVLDVVGMICADAGCQATRSAPAIATTRTSARTGVVWRGCTSSGLRCAR